MSPEERQEKINFIIASYADFSAKMDRLDADSARNDEEHRTFKKDLAVRGDDIEHLKRLADQFLRILRVEHEVLMADRQTRLAEIEAERKAREAQFEAERRAREAHLEAERERRKELEGRVDGIEEMTKFLRELLEGNLRPPEKPPETEH